MSVYLDASVLVALFTNDLLTARPETFLRADPLVVIVSDFAAVLATRAQQPGGDPNELV